MTAPQIKVKVHRRPQIKLKVLPKFPSSVTGEGGIEVTNVGGNYVISPELGVLGDVIGPGADASVAGEIAVFTDGNNIEGSGLSADDLSFGYDTIAAAEAATIPVSASVVPIFGYYAAGDGGSALYKYVASEPSHPGKFQSANSRWFEIAEKDLNVRMFGAVGDGASNDSPAFDDAIETAVALGTGRAIVPDDSDYLIFTPIDIDGLFDFELVGRGSTITYPGALCAVSARSTARCKVSGLLVLVTEAARIVDARTNVGNTSSLQIDGCKLQHTNVGSVATRIGVDFDDNETASITNTTISVSAGIDVQGISGGGHFVVGCTISDCVFPNQTALNHVKGPGDSWLIARNEFELCLGPVIAKGTAGTSSSLTLLSNWMGDSPGVPVTWSLVTSNTETLVSMGNIYATSIGGGGSSTCITQDNSTGSVTSISDYLEADVGIAVGTGNRLKISNHNLTHPPTTLYTGTPSNANLAETIGGVVDITGKLSLGLSGSDQGELRFWNATLGAHNTTIRPAAGATGVIAITLPGISGTVVTEAGAAELDNKTLDSSVGKGTWTASGTWTLPAFTVGGTISGGNNQLNNIIVGTISPRAGFFTDLSASSSLAVTGTNATTRNTNGQSTISLLNNDGGTAADARFQASNGTGSIAFGMWGTGKNAYGAIASNTAFIYGATDFTIMSDGGAIKFAAGNNGQDAQIGTSGGFSVGTTTDPGAGAIQTTAGILAYGATAVPAGGTTGAGYKFSSTSNLGVFFGSGAPSLSAAQGSLYVRTDGSSTSTRLYVNTNGTTGWTNVTTAT